MDNTIKLDYSSAITDLVELNPSFDSGKLQIAYYGNNRNMTHISKEAFEDAVSSMYGTPVVVNYIREEDELGSHDGEIVRDSDGKLKYVNITEPVGFVPTGAEWKWELIKDDNGEVHDYLTTEVVLWKRQEAYSKIKENGITSQSMEITVIDGEMVGDYYYINKFYFTAFCLLGKAEPCFESAALITYEKNKDMQTQLTEMYEEFKLAFAKNENKTLNEEVGEDKMNLEELMAKYNISNEDITFDIDGLTQEEIEAKFEDVFGEDIQGDGSDEPEADPEADPVDDDTESDEDEGGEDSNFNLISQVSSLLRSQISTMEVLEDEWGTYPRYYMIDFDAEAYEVYFEDSTDWNIYGTTYSFDGDEVVIDMKCKKRKKYAIVDFVEGSSEQFSMKDFVEQFVNASNKKHQESYEALESKYNDLVKKSNKIASEELFAKFEDKLADTAEFEVLKTKAETMTTEELEEKLYALVGKKQFKYSNNVKSNKSPKAPVVPSDHDKKGVDDPYGDLFNFIKK